MAKEIKKIGRGINHHLKNYFLASLVILLFILWSAIFLNFRFTGNAVLENYSVISGTFSLIVIILICIALMAMRYIKRLN